MEIRIPVVLLYIVVILGALKASADDVTEMPDVVAGCVVCHQKEGVPAAPGWPHLAGMEKTEIISILKGHRARLIPDSTMAKIAAGLSDSEIEQVADYYSKIERTDPQPLRLTE